MKKLFEEINLLEQSLSPQDAGILIVAAKYGMKFGSANWHIETDDVDDIVDDEMVMIIGRSGSEQAPPRDDARHIVQKIKQKYRGIKFGGEMVDEWYTITMTME